MTGKIFVVIFGFLFIQVSSARVIRREVQKPIDPFNTFTQLFLEFHDKATKTAESYIKPLDAAVKPLAKTFDDTIGTLNEQVGGLLTNLQSNIEKDVNKATKPLKKEFPELSKELGFFAKSTQNLFTKLSTTGDKQVKEAGNKFLETAVALLNVVNNKVQEVGKKE